VRTRRDLTSVQFVEVIVPRISNILIVLIRNGLSLYTIQNELMDKRLLSNTARWNNIWIGLVGISLN